MSSPPSRRRRRTEMERPPPAPVVRAAARDWAALPRDVLLGVFLRLRPREVMLGAEHACTAWRRAAIEEPVLWRRVGMENPFADKTYETWRYVSHIGEEAMKLAAVGRAAGQCEAFCGACDDDDLLDLVQRAPHLKSLNIEHSSDYDSGEALVEALKKLTLLEDLQIHFPYYIDWEENMLQSVCQACPRLKKLVLMYVSNFDLECNEDECSKEAIDGAIPMMSELHTLKLYECDLSCKGLEAILDCCPQLETLHIDGYFDKREMDKELRIKCARVKNLTLPTRAESYNSHDDDYSEYYNSQDEDSYSEEQYYDCQE